MRNPDFCLWENKGADQLCGNCTADQRLCIRYWDSTFSLLPKFILIPSFLPSPVCVYRLVCVGPGRKHQRPVFSHHGSIYKQKTYNSSSIHTEIYTVTHVLFVASLKTFTIVEWVPPEFIV